MTGKKLDPLFCVAEVQIDGPLRRLQFAARVLFTGQAEISFDVLHFLTHLSEQMDGNTTCMLLESTEELAAQERTDTYVAAGRAE